MRAEWRLALGEPAEAAADLERALALDPDSGVALVIRAELHREAKRWDAARADLERAIRLARAGRVDFRAVNGESGLWLRLGDVLRLARRLGPALEAYDQAVKLAPDNVEALEHRGALRLEAGRPRDALADFERAVQLAPRRPLALLNRVRALAALGDTRRALAEITRITGELLPRSARAWHLRARLHKQLGQQATALRCHDKALQLDPRYVTAWIDRGVLRLEQGQPERAIGDFDRAIALAPDRPEPDLNRGNARADLNLHAQALADYDRCAELAPRAWIVYQNRGLLLAELGRVERARGDLRRAIELAPTADVRAELEAALRRLETR